MLDTHIHPADWGVRPILFHFFGLPVPSYEFFVSLALIVGGLVYFWEARRTKSANENAFLIAVAAIIGGALGAKLLEFIITWQFVIAHISEPLLLLAGRTVIGGLLGGMIGVLLVKRHLRIKERKGNLFAPAVAIGLAIGRVGCFFRGCCYGTATNLPWGVDFGDGILRHPTQLYEALFALLFFIYVQWAKRQKPASGTLFTQFIVSYFVFRFFIEFIRGDHALYFGLSIYQYVCLLGILFVFRNEIFLCVRKSFVAK